MAALYQKCDYDSHHCRDEATEKDFHSKAPSSLIAYIGSLTYASQILWADSKCRFRAARGEWFEVGVVDATKVVADLVCGFDLEGLPRSYAANPAAGHRIGHKKDRERDCSRPGYI